MPGTPRAPLPGQLLGQVGSLRAGNCVDHVLTGQGEHTSKGVWDHPNLSILKGRVKLRTHTGRHVCHLCARDSTPSAPPHGSLSSAQPARPRQTLKGVESIRNPPLAPPTAPEVITPNTGFSTLQAKAAWPHQTSQPHSRGICGLRDSSCVLEIDIIS